VSCSSFPIIDTDLRYLSFGPMSADDDGAAEREAIYNQLADGVEELRTRLDGELLRQLTLDPTRDYQPQG
jgi:hypothetical protein